MKKFLVFFVVLLMGLSIFAEVGVTDTEIKLGSFQALSGPVAGIGVPMTQGMNAYFDWVNKNGGVHGRQIKLLVADDQFQPSRTNVEVRRLVENDRVFAIVGGLGTPGTLAVMDYLNNNKVPFVYQGSGASVLSFPPKEYIFPVQPNYITEGNIVVNYLTEVKGAQRIAIVYRNAEDGIEFFESARDALQAKGMNFVEALAVAPDVTNFTAQVTRLRRARPDAILVMTFMPATSNLVKQIRQFGMNDTDVLLTYSNSDVTFIGLTGAEAEGVEAMAWVNVDFTDSTTPALSIFNEAFGTIPNAFAVAGMIAAETFTEALRRAGPNLTRDSLIKALETFDAWEGEIGPPLSYGSHNLADYSSRLGLGAMYVLKVENGTWVEANTWIYADIK